MAHRWCWFTMMLSLLQNKCLEQSLARANATVSYCTVFSLIITFVMMKGPNDQILDNDERECVELEWKNKKIYHNNQRWCVNMTEKKKL